MEQPQYNDQVYVEVFYVPWSIPCWDV